MFICLTSTLFLLLALGAAYLLWIFASKESGTVRLIGQIIAVVAAVIAVVLLIYGAMYGPKMKGKMMGMCGMHGMGYHHMMDADMGKKMMTKEKKSK